MRVVILSLFLGLTSALAQSPSPVPVGSPSPTPSARPPDVVLRFALPPLDGTISLGVYNSSGKIVRVLHREDGLDDFTQGHDALETHWDGNDDEGHSLPAGKYHARGFVVGGLKVDGIDYFFNDWVTDDKSPHVRSLGQLWLESGVLQVDAILAGNKHTTLICDQSSGAVQGQLPPKTGAHCPETPPLANLVSPIDCARGREKTTWFIDSLGGAASNEVKQISGEHQLLRRLSYAATDPQPVRIEASPTEEKIFLIEQNNQLQRLRALTLVRTTSESAGEAVSDWKIVFEKKIIPHQDFSLENGKPVATRATSQTGPEKVTQKLRPDPLQHNKAGEVELAIGIDRDGSFLRTADGLPLRTISDNPNLVRTVLTRPNDEAIDLFQDDGAVVEQFRVSNLGQMIAFDCGDFDLQ